MLRITVAILLLASSAQADYIVRADTANFTADSISPNGTRIPVQGMIETIEVMNVQPVALAKQDPGMNIQIIVSPLNETNAGITAPENENSSSEESELGNLDFDQFPPSSRFDLPASAPSPPPLQNANAFPRSNVQSSPNPITFSNLPLKPLNYSANPKGNAQANSLYDFPFPPTQSNVSVSGATVPQSEVIPASSSDSNTDLDYELGYPEQDTWPMDSEKISAEAQTNSTPAVDDSLSTNYTNPSTNGTYPSTNYTFPNQFDTLLNSTNQTSTQNTSNLMPFSPQNANLPPSSLSTGSAGQQPFSFPWFNTGFWNQSKNANSSAVNNSTLNPFAFNMPAFNFSQTNLPAGMVTKPGPPTFVQNVNPFAVKHPGRGPFADDDFAAPVAPAKKNGSKPVAVSNHTSDKTSSESSESVLDQLFDIFSRDNDSVEYVDYDVTDEPPNHDHKEPVDMDFTDTDSDMNPFMYLNDVRFNESESAKPFSMWPTFNNPFMQKPPAVFKPPTFPGFTNPWAQQQLPQPQVNPWFQLFNMSRTPTNNVANFNFFKFNGNPWKSSNVGNAQMFSDTPNFNTSTVLQNLTFPAASSDGKSAGSYIGVLNGSSVNLSTLLKDAMDSAENTTSLEVDYEIDVIAKPELQPAGTSFGKSKKLKTKSTTEEPTETMLSDFDDVMADDGEAYDYGGPVIPSSVFGESESNTTTSSPAESRGIAVSVSWTMALYVLVAYVGQRIFV